MTSDVKNAYSHSNARGQYAGFSQIRSHILLLVLIDIDWLLNKC